MNIFSKIEKVIEKDFAGLLKHKKQNEKAKAKTKKITKSKVIEGLNDIFNEEFGKK